MEQRVIAWLANRVRWQVKQTLCGGLPTKGTAENGISYMQPQPSKVLPLVFPLAVHPVPRVPGSSVR